MMCLDNGLPRKQGYNVRSYRCKHVGSYLLIEIGIVLNISNIMYKSITGNILI